jgi:hypothetical protein
MHLNFGFSAAQILWTLTFAALLVLLVVLLGRNRAQRFPWFTASMAILALRMLTSRLLFGRMAPIVLSEIYLALADVAVIIALLVVVEMARRAFAGASLRAWIVGTVVLLCIGAWILAPVWYFPGNGVEGTIGRVSWMNHWRLLAFSGPWPAWQTLTAGSRVAILRLMQLVAQKADMLADLLIVQLCLLVTLFGTRFKAGWRSHVQQIVIGLSTAAIAELARFGIWQAIALHTTIHSRAEYDRVMALQEKFFNATSVIFLAALVWWIVCLWIDEPIAPSAAGATGQVVPAADAKTSPPEPSDAGVK